MRILMTGASSFSGSWFCRALVEAGAAVTVTLRRAGMNAYADTDLERGRIALWDERVNPVFACAFGDACFLEELERGQYSALCLHGARVGAYQSREFPVDAAVAENTRNLEAVLKVFRARGGDRVVLTHTYFAADPGHPVAPHGSVSLYGESKAQTLERVRGACREAGLELRVFWIPNPFGKWEKPGLNAYLFRSWVKGDTPVLKTPEVVRDFVPVDVLGLAYAGFVLARDEELSYRPGLFGESNLAFARRLAGHVEGTLGRACRVEVGRPPEDFSEPNELVQGDAVLDRVKDWDAQAFWAEYVRWGIGFYG